MVRDIANRVFRISRKTSSGEVEVNGWHRTLFLHAGRVAKDIKEVYGLRGREITVSVRADGDTVKVGYAVGRSCDVMESFGEITLEDLQNVYDSKDESEESVVYRELSEMVMGLNNIGIKPTSLYILYNSYTGTSTVFFENASDVFVKVIGGSYKGLNTLVKEDDEYVTEARELAKLLVKKSKGHMSYTMVITLADGGYTVTRIGNEFNMLGILRVSNDSFYSDDLGSEGTDDTSRILSCIKNLFSRVAGCHTVILECGQTGSLYEIGLDCWEV